MSKPLFSHSQIDSIIASMVHGTHGSFAKALGEAYFLADSGNQYIILCSFSTLIRKVASFLDIEEQK